jgi:WD40 repeat protein
MLAAAEPLLEGMRALAGQIAIETEQRQAEAERQAAEEQQRLQTARATLARQEEERRQRVAREQARRQELEQLKAAQLRKSRERMANLEHFGAKLRLLPWDWIVLGLAVVSVPVTFLKPGTFPWLPVAVLIAGVVARRMAIGSKWPATVAIAMGLVAAGAGGYIQYGRKPGPAFTRYPVPPPGSPRPVPAAGEATTNLTYSTRWSLDFQNRRYRRYGSEIAALAPVPGGRLVAAANGSTIELWDTALESVLRTLPDARQSQSPNNAGMGLTRSERLSISADGRLLVTGGGTLSSSTRLFDLHTGEMIRSFVSSDPGSQMPALALSPSGQVLACVVAARFGQSNYVALWNIGTGDLLRKLAPPPLAPARGILPMIVKEEATCLAFAPDGKTLACGYKVSGGRGVVRIWDVEGGAPARICSTPINAGNRKEWVVSVAYSPDGKTLACGYADTGGTPSFGELRLWSLDASGGSPKTIFRSAQPQSGTEVEPRVLAFSPDGRCLACGFHRPLAPWEIRTYDLRAGAALTTITDTPSGLGGSSLGEVSGLCFTADGKDLVCAFTGGSSGQERALFHVREVATGKMIRSVGAQGLERAAGVRALAVSGDGATLACGFGGPASRGEIALVAQGHGNHPRFVPDPSINPTNFNRLEFIGALAFLPGDQRIVCAYDGPDSDDGLSIWDVEKGDRVKKLSAPVETAGGGERARVVSLAVSPDGRAALCACRGAAGQFEARLWDLEAGTLRCRTKLPTQPGNAVVFAAFPTTNQPLVGSYRAAAAAGRLVLLNPQSGAVLRTLDTAPGEYPEGFTPTAAALSPDGRTLFCAHSRFEESSFNEPVRFWDISGDVLRATIQTRNSFSFGGGSVISAATFFNQGKGLVCGNNNGGIQVWELSTTGSGASRSVTPRRK